MSDDNVRHIGGDGEIGKTAAMLKDELQTLLDTYSGAITNAEALGCLMIQVLDTYFLCREDDE